MNILVLDVGTSSMRGTLLDASSKALFAEQIKYRPAYGKHGAVEQDPRDWLDAMRSLCAGAAEAYTVDAVALTCQRSSVIPADEAGAPLTRAIMWQDTRNRAVCNRLQSREADIRDICGTGINTVYSGGKMAWLRETHPEIYAGAAHLFVIPDYLIWQLTGTHVTDHTYGSRSMLMDLRKLQWSPALLSLFGADREKLGQLISPSSEAGTVTEQFAAETGLTAGIPVITCGGDQQCGALGQGVLGPGQVSVNLGTGAYLIAPVGAVPDHLEAGLICNASAIPGQYILESGVLTCGAALDWFLREIGGDVTLVGEALRRSPPGAGGVTVLPYFQGRADPDWNSDAKAAFFGLSLGTTRQDMLRALLEAICVEVCRSLRQVAGNTDPRELHLGGGMSRTPELGQLLADVTGTEVIVSEDSDATTRGAWMSAARCLGIADSWEAAWKLARPGREKSYMPDMGRKPIYDGIAHRMERLYAATK